MNDKKTLIANLIKSFLVSFAWMNIGCLESTNILLLCVFGASFLLLTYKRAIVPEIKNNERVSSFILGALFVVLYGLYADLTGGLENKLFVIIYVLFTVLGLFVMFSELLQVLINKACLVEKKNIINDKPFSWKLFLVYSGIVFVCTFPFLTLNFPGVLTPDSLNQMYQHWGMEPYSNHHPWLHTALMGLFYDFGYRITGDIHTSIAFYTVFQMIIVSISVGYALECLYEMGIGKKWINVVLIAYLILPYNLIYSITLWKDILFTMSVLVITMTIIRLEEKDSLRDNIIFVISGIAMCVLRHNGFYAFIATVVIWLFIKRQELKKYILYSALIIVVGMLCRGPLMKAAGVEPGEYVYNMCIPLQQIGRVVIEDGELDEDDQQWLLNINNFDYIKAGYSTQGADPMFAWVLDGNREYFDTHKAEFIKVWASVGLRHPMSYLNAFIDLTMGYWAPMKPQQTVYFGITTPNEIDLWAKPIVEGPVLIKINELITKFYEMIPIYGFMYCMGGYFWVLLISGAICICKGNANRLFAFLPVFMLTLTLFIATPLVADIRYGYALLVILPYLLVYTNKE